MKRTTLLYGYGVSSEWLMAKGYDGAPEGRPILRLWLPVAGITLVVVAYAFFYALDVTETQGSTSIGLANAAGLVAVIVGLIAAVLIMRRGAPPIDSPDSRNP